MEVEVRKITAIGTRVGLNVVKDRVLLVMFGSTALLGTYGVKWTGVNVKGLSR
jgi:hypothetical protein